MTEPRRVSHGTDWENRIGHAAAGPPSARDAPRLDPPDGPAGRAGRRTRSRCTWEPVPGRDRLPGATPPRRRTARASRSTTPAATCSRCPHPPYADTTGDAGRDAVVRGDRALRRASRGGPLPSRSSARRSPAGAGRGTVTVDVDAGDDRGALPRPWRPMIGCEHLSHMLSTDTTGGRRDRRGAAPRRCGGARRARRQPRAGARDPLRRPRRLPRGRRRAGARLRRRRPGLRPPALDRAATRSSSCRSCRTTWRPTRRRRCSTTPRSSRRPRTGTAGTTWSATWSRTSSTATASRRWSSTGRSRCGTRPTSRCSGRARPRSTCGSTT